MTDFQALIALRDAVREGLPSPTNWRNFAALPVGDEDSPNPILAHRAYHGSLDAALALHNALLPERYGVALQYSKRYAAKAIILDPMDKAEYSSGDEWVDPARALLLAILEAKIQEATPCAS